MQEKVNIGDKVIAFNKQLHYEGNLPKGFGVMNPYLNNPETITVMEQFYKKYYNDSELRKFIVGINPSPHGAGITGVPFTDTKRLENVCGIAMKSAHTHEISSVFMYDMISDFGGADEFFRRFYINSPFPLAIIRQSKSGQWNNANYYDDAALFRMVKNFMIESLTIQMSMGLDPATVFVLGKKNSQFIHQINDEAKLFDNIITLEHPRYIQQYKSREKQQYIDKYIIALNG